MTEWQPTDNWRYESAIAEVETIIQRIESGELDLSEVIEQFQTAAHTLKQCDTFLTQKQNQVELIIEEISKPEIPASTPTEEDLDF
ncbi:MAG: exodeoxyribonuclease VII small subunit [Synechococcaceae cyanobacterium SM2_3_1]|nr:exodeoxyribonuclease VII small subunit [Synechococcaceae cyanobacterium SM2_3_1]